MTKQINFNKLCIDTWNDIVTIIDEGKINYSSEKTLVFNYAWLLKIKLLKLN